MKIRFGILLGTAFIAGLTVICGGGCRCAPEPAAGFVPAKIMTASAEGTAFRREWYSKKYLCKNYRQVYVAPIRTDFRLPNSGFESGIDFGGEAQADFKEYCQYVRNALRQAIVRRGQFKLASQPGPDTVTLELALVKVVPGKPVYHACMIIVPFPLNIGINAGLNALTDDAFSSSCAMECRAVTPQGKILIMGLADNEQQKAAIINFLNFTRYGNQRQTADEWADAIATKLSSPNAGLPAPQVFVLFNY